MFECHSICKGVLIMIFVFCDIYLLAKTSHWDDSTKQLDTTSKSEPNLGEDVPDNSEALVLLQICQPLINNNFFFFFVFPKPLAINAIQIEAEPDQCAGNNLQFVSKWDVKHMAKHTARGPKPVH